MKLEPRPKMGDEEIDNLVMRAFIEMDVPFSKSLTIHDFTKWATTLIERVEDLADAFRVNWRFSTLSDFERKGMAPVHQFRRGMITLPQLQYLWAKRAIKFRSSLALKQQRLMHERAMSMGEDDPTKPDYSKYMPKAKGQYFDTKMRPLRHQRLHNKQWYVQQIETFWAIRIQSAYRALAGRRAADVEAKRQAFYAAKELARADAESKVRAEYDTLENLTAGSTKRLKWDAKVRMQQVKLRTKGLSLNREECVRYMVDKNVDKALRKVEKGFQTMEKESGFSMTDREKRLQHDADKMRLAYLTSLKDTGKPDADASRGGEGEASATDGTFSGSGGAAQVAKFQDMSGEAKRKMLRDAEVNRQRERRRSLVLCDFDQRPELFDVGETSKERKLRILLAHPNPTQGALMKHLCSMHRDFTQKRVLEMLQELPSKRLLLQYVMRFRDAKALGWHLHDHFSFLNRDAESMARALINLSRADFEYGRIEGRVRMLLDEHQHSLHRVALLDADEAKSAIDKIDIRRIGQLQAEMNRKKVHVRNNDNDDNGSEEEGDEDSISNNEKGPVLQSEVQLDLLVEKDEEELGEAEKLLDEVRRELAAAQARTAEAMYTVARLKKRLQDREHIACISRQDRTAWNRRLTNCIDLPETNDIEVHAKYSEMAALFHDFKHCAT